MANNGYQLFGAQSFTSPSPVSSPDETETMTIDTIIYNIHNNLSVTPSYGLNDLTPGFFKITKEELENIKKKKTMNILAKHIDNYLKKKPNKLYNLTLYTLFSIDEIQADIYISNETDANNVSKYFYKIISRNIYYEELDEDETSISSDERNTDLVIYDNYGFETILDLLVDIKYVEENYKLLDYYLLSPESMEEALAQREFMPIHKDKICTVCYEPTREYTTCKHSICLKCREKCIVQDNKMCPICRTSDLRVYPK